MQAVHSSASGCYLLATHKTFSRQVLLAAYINFTVPAVSRLCRLHHLSVVQVLAGDRTGLLTAPNVSNLQESSQFCKALRPALVQAVFLPHEIKAPQMQACRIHCQSICFAAGGRNVNHQSSPIK